MICTTTYQELYNLTFQTLIFLFICDFIGSGKEECFYYLKAVTRSMWLYKEFKRCRKFSTRCICDLIISDRNTHLHQLHWLQRDLKSIFPKKTDLLQVLQHLFSKLHRYICFRDMKCVKNNVLEIKSFYHLIPPWEERWQRFTWCKLQHLRWPMFSVTPSRNLSRSNLFSSYSTETPRSYSKNIFLKKHSGCQRNYHFKKK